MRNDGKSLKGRKLFIPAMTREGALGIAAAFRSAGVDACVMPPSDGRTLELGGKFTSGEECLPQRVTMGDLMRILEEGELKPSEIALFMPLAPGPCRFGQYAPLFEKVMRDCGYEDVYILSPSSVDGYGELGMQGKDFTRIAWWAIVTTDILRKMLYKIRPYEKEKGKTDEVFERGLQEVCSVIERRDVKSKEKFALLVETMKWARDEFRKIEKRNEERPLIGVVGEIFCRLNHFSNQNTIRKVEEHGGEVWLSDMTEWIWYVNAERRRKLILYGKKWSTEMLDAKIRAHFQHKDEHKLMEHFHHDLKGREEPTDFEEILELGKPYLPFGKVMGEMVVSIGRVCYLHKMGVDGIIDISPFTCMNGIVSEAVYPKISKEHDNMPIKVFYFDSVQVELDRDVGIFMELAKNYKRKKKYKSEIVESRKNKKK